MSITAAQALQARRGPSVERRAQRHSNRLTTASGQTRLPWNCDAQAIMRRLRAAASARHDRCGPANSLRLETMLSSLGRVESCKRQSQLLCWVTDNVSRDSTGSSEHRWAGGWLTRMDCMAKAVEKPTPIKR